MIVDLEHLEYLRESATDWIDREEYLAECEIAMPALLAELKAARKLKSKIQAYLTMNTSNYSNNIFRDIWEALSAYERAKEI